MNKFFATFGGGQLKDFDVKPMDVMLLSGEDNEGMFRMKLRQEPFNNEYCTTYPIDRAAGMMDDYGMTTYTMNELLERHK